MDIGGAASLAELVQRSQLRQYSLPLQDSCANTGAAARTNPYPTEVSHRGYEGTSSVDDLLDFAERSVLSIVQGKLDRSFTP